MTSEPAVYMFIKGRAVPAGYTPGKVRSTQAQLRHMIAYMTENPDLASGQTPPNMGPKYHLKWLHLKNKLKDYGPDKTIDQWKHTWRDMKRKAKEELRRYQQDVKDNKDALEMSNQARAVLQAMKNSQNCDSDSELTFGRNSKFRVLEIAEEDNNTLEQSTTEEEPKHDPLVYEGVEFLEQECSSASQNYLEEDTKDVPCRRIRRKRSLSESSNSSSTPNKVKKKPDPKTNDSEILKDVPRRRIRRKRSLSESSNSSSTPNKMKKKPDPKTNDSEILITLNKFIEYENEKEKLAHEREMSRITQNGQLLNVLGKLVNVLEELSPSVKKFIDHVNTNKS